MNSFILSIHQAFHQANLTWRLAALSFFSEISHPLEAYAMELAWLYVTQMRDRVLEVQLIGGEHDGEIVLIPQVSLFLSASSADVTFRFKRRQFPVWLAFALSINKAQGQSV